MFAKIIKHIFKAAGLKVSKISSFEGRDNYTLKDLLPFINLQQGAVIIDGGTNEGQTIDLLLKHQQDLKIIAIEPDKKLHKKLQKKYKDNKHVSVHDYALSDQNKIYQFNSYKASKLSSIKTLNPNSNQNSTLENTRDVQGKTIDRLIKEEQLASVDLLKLDLQGFELEALQGAEQSIRNGMIKWIFVEIMVGDMYINTKNEKNNLLKIFELLNDAFEVYTMVDFNYGDQLKFSHCDILFKRRIS